MLIISSSFLFKNSPLFSWTSNNLHTSSARYVQCSLHFNLIYSSDQTEESQTINESQIILAVGIIIRKLAIQTLNLQRTFFPMHPLCIMTGLPVKPELKCAADKVSLAWRLYRNWSKREREKHITHGISLSVGAYVFVCLRGKALKMLFAWIDYSSIISVSYTCLVSQETDQAWGP